jgi:hypothetical protein
MDQCITANITLQLHLSDEMVRLAQYESMVFENTVESLVVI